MSKKKVEEKRKKERSRRLLYAGISAVVFIVAIVVLFIVWTGQAPAADSWSINESGMLSFGNRGSIQASAKVLENNDNYSMEKVTFKSFGDDVYALLRRPANITKPPVVVVLPAATVTKEMDEATAKALCDMGYASLTLDLRGNGGETRGYWVGNWSLGLSDFLAGGNPMQYKQVYDALKGLDYVKSRPDLDGNDIAILGESMGGMWSIVAAGIEPQFKGVITISSCDFDSPGSYGTGAQKFINAVMPSRYLSSLPPRKLAMFQFTNDTIVTVAQGRALFDKASEPKAWHEYPGDSHGLYNSAFATDLQAELKGILGR